MRKRQVFSTLLASIMVAGQFGWVAVAAADDQTPTPTPSEQASPTVSPSSSPEPTATPAPSQSPSPSSSPAPSASASPSPAPSASASPAPTPTPKPSITDIGPNGCGGVIPSWVYDTTTGKWVAADKGSFTCDKSTGYYMSPKYVYDKHSGWYKIVPASAIATLPDYVLTTPNVVHTVLGDLVVGSKDYQVAAQLGLLAPVSGGNGIAIDGTGPGSTNTATTTNNGQTWMDLTNLVNVINTLQSVATSGDVTAASNTSVGNLSSGTASVLANVINLLASAWSWSSGNLNFFTQTFWDNFNGDLNLNPTQTATGGGGQLGTATVANTGPDSTNIAGTSNTNTLDVNAKNSGNINNNLDLSAVSGNASATGNTGVGNVGTGNAVAEANIINLINSFITSGSSFFGILNFMANFNGDVLFPKGFLDGLVPSSAGLPAGTTAGVGSTGPGSTNTAGVTNDSQTSINNTSTMGVNNNIAANAASGSATAGQNSTVGNVSTGNSTTQSGLFNMANSSIFGDNAVLVIVNVLGHWVGKIMTLPNSGTTSSALLTGGATVGATQTGPDSTNQANVTNTDKANINQTSEGTITNNVNLNAQSGDATATENTKVGDVMTGSAKAVSSVANIFNSVLNVKHWFGVLVINVFGDWTGDVNHDTAAGGYSTQEAAAAAGAGVTAGTTVPDSVAGGVPSYGLLGLVKSAAGNGSNSGTATVSDGSNANVTATNAKVLTAAAQSNPKDVAAAAQSKNLTFMFILSAIVMLIAGALLTIDKKLKNR